MLRWADLGQMHTQPHFLPISARWGEKVEKKKVMDQDKDRGIIYW